VHAGRAFRVAADPPPAEAADSIAAVVIWSDLSEEAACPQTAALQILGQMAGSTAHDINNLLTVILGNCSLALDVLPPGSPAAGPLSTAASATTLAGELTARLLAFARGNTHAQPMLVDVNHVIKEALELLGSSLSLRITRCLRLTPDLPRLTASRAELLQVVVNLCLNARDAMPQGGTLTVETQLVPWALPGDGRPGMGPLLRLRIADTGLGIPTDVQSRMFQSFVTSKPAGMGTGLGLATVHRIVRGMGGWICWETSPGQGTRFDLMLPVSAAHSSSEKTAPSLNAHSNTRSRND
jgi:signal transduction histidine kinase